MTLRIIKADDPIEIKQLVITLYGVPGLGKSTLGFSAHNPVLLDFDNGAYRAANRKDSVHIEKWEDAANITAEDLKPYDTVIVDTAGRALDFLTKNIIDNDPKKGNGGALTLQGFGVLKSRFIAWLTSLKLLGKDVVLVAHSSEDKKGDDIIERIDVQGGSKGEIYKSADAMGRLYLVNGKRVLSFSPTDTAFGKNPGNLEPLQVPDIADDPEFLGSVVDTIKTRLNTLTEAQKARLSAVADWKAKIEEANTAEDFTTLVTEIKQVDAGIAKTVKGLIHKTATEKGFEFDTKKKAYVGDAT
jgi:hypothetical protein